MCCYCSWDETGGLLSIRSSSYEKGRGIKGGEERGGRRERKEHMKKNERKTQKH